MNLKTAVFLAIALMLSACKKKEGEQKENLKFEMKTFHYVSTQGCMPDTAQCASYEVEYPEFNSLPEVVRDTLNKRIVESIDTGNPEITTLSFEAAGKAFINDFEEAQAEFPDNTMGWYFKGSVHVNLFNDTLLSLESKAEFFTGGAHGGYGTYFINIHPATAQRFTLDDFFNAGYEEPLRKIGESEFRKVLNIADTTSLAEEGFEFPDNRFMLNDNYGFTQKGIVFIFNIYEIAPYVLGAQRILIPYEKVEHMIR